MELIRWRSAAAAEEQSAVRHGHGRRDLVWMEKKKKKKWNCQVHLTTAGRCDKKSKILKQF